MQDLRLRILFQMISSYFWHGKLFSNTDAILKLRFFRRKKSFYKTINGPHIFTTPHTYSTSLLGHLTPFWYAWERGDKDLNGPWTPRFLLTSQLTSQKQMCFVNSWVWLWGTRSCDRVVHSWTMSCFKAATSLLPLLLGCIYSLHMWFLLQFDFLKAMRVSA
jgi:hypothetical protein